MIFKIFSQVKKEPSSRQTIDTKNKQTHKESLVSAVDSISIRTLTFKFESSELKPL